MQGHELFDPWAPHPVVNKNICFGGGGGTSMPTTPNIPDYTQYISAMSNIGNQGQQWSSDLYNWAQNQGVDLNSLAKTVSGAAGTAATGQQQTADQTMGQWQNLSAPLYQGQADATERMIKNLPQYEEEQAGKAGADAATAIDQQKAAATRAMAARGLPPNAAATGALDTEAGTQRAMAVTSAAETARTAARTEALTDTANTLQSEQGMANVGATQGALATQDRTQQATLPMQGATTSAGLYQPAMGMYSSSYPYMAQWGSTMGQSFNEGLANYSGALQGYKAGEELGAYSPLSTIGALGAGIAGSYLGGPAGGMIGSKIGGMLGGMAGGSSGGGADAIMGLGHAAGGAIDAVPPTASPSRGRRTDDVHAALSVGEFVMPKRTVDWYGDKFFHNLIAKADKDQGQPPQPVGPEAGPSAAIMTGAPMFRSEGART